MSVIRYYFLAMAVAGTLIPWYFFGSYLLAQPFSLLGIFNDLFVNGMAAGFTSDLLISALVFLVWSLRECRGNAPLMSIILLSTMLVGLSLALPLFLFLREGSQGARESVVS